MVWRCGRGISFMTRDIEHLLGCLFTFAVLFSQKSLSVLYILGFGIFLMHL